MAQPRATSGAALATWFGQACHRTCWSGNRVVAVALSGAWRRPGCFTPVAAGRAYRTGPARSQESAMTSDDKPRRVEVRDGDQTVAAAEVAEHAEGTIRTSLLPSS